MQGFSLRDNFAHCVVFVLTGVFAAEDNFGSSSCPCIEWADLGNYVENGVLVYRPVGSLLSYDYPVNYGNIMCKAHDLDLPPLCNWGSSDNPQWCANEWCYVDSSNCDKPMSKSRFFPNVDDLYYSYATCAGESGSSNQFDLWTLAGTDGTSELLDLVQGYLKASRMQIEEAYEQITDWSAISDCGFSKTCPCLACTDNQNWKTAIDLSDVGVWLRSDSDIVACLSHAISTTYLKVAAKESDVAGSKVGFQYFADQLTGSYVQWPNTQWCPVADYDPRFRPWYAAASTGPKDVVIVADVSGSMGKNGRSGLAKAATKAILDTLTWKDFATIILFDSSVMSTFSQTLVSVTEAQRNIMQNWVDGKSWENGGTDFRDAFFQDNEDGHGAFTIIRNSVAAGQTSMCQKVIMFLTDGTSEFDKSDFENAKQLAHQYDVVIFSYAIGDGADRVVGKRLACENRGIFYPVADGADLSTTMASYYQYFAAGQEMCSPSYVEYTDAITSTQLYAGCLTMYDRSNPRPEILGVTCSDLNMIESIDVMKNLSGWHDLSCKMSDISKTCRPLELQECHIEQLRANVGSTSVCQSADYASGCPCIDTDCKDNPTFMDELGYFCDTWIGDDCTEAESRWGYTAGGQDAVQINCKRSCGLCDWKDDCPYEKAPSCTAEASAVPSFCRACETDKTSGVDIEGCYMSCGAKGEVRVCETIVNSAVRCGVFGLLSLVITAFAATVVATRPDEA